VTVERSIRSAENAVDIVAALEIDVPIGEEEPKVAVPVPAMEADILPGLPEGDPEVIALDPPALADNWANPTDGGEERNTEYTFFRNVSPTTQLS